MVAVFVMLLYIAKIIFGGLFIGGFFNPPIGKEKMERIFNKDLELLVTVTTYFENSDYRYIYI